MRELIIATSIFFKKDGPDLLGICKTVDKVDAYLRNFTLIMKYVFSIR